jgi:hypothetical protein
MTVRPRPQATPPLQPSARGSHARRGIVRGRGLRATAWLLLFGPAACELQDVTIADVGEAVIAEVLLQAGAERQLALLHRTLGTKSGAAVPGAIIEVRDAAGRVLVYEPARDEDCLDVDEDRQDLVVGSCYRSVANPPFTVQPAATYSLSITLRDGGRLAGRTTVPGPFSITVPAAVRCAVPVDSTLELVWTTSSGAWVYVVETSLAGIRAALRPAGIDVPRDPLRLFGLAIAGQDTSIVFPSEFGLFDRADPELGPVLVALQKGLPPGVEADVVVAAADRNYVNWARGGNFNPSGVVRVPSVSGDGTGVFGSLVPLRRRLESSADRTLPRCN